MVSSEGNKAMQESLQGHATADVQHAFKTSLCSNTSKQVHLDGVRDPKHLLSGHNQLLIKHTRKRTKTHFANSTSHTARHIDDCLDRHA